MVASDHLSDGEFGRRLSGRERRSKDPAEFYPHGSVFSDPRSVEEVFSDNPFPGEDDHLGGQQHFYHGTDREFSTGDNIRPRSKNVSHATPSLETAKVFGKNTYEVEPLNRVTTFNRPMKYTQGEAHTETLSEEGFRVRRKLDS